MVILGTVLGNPK